MALSIVISQKELSKKINSIVRVIKSKNNITAYENILFEALSGLNAIASDGATRVRASLNPISCEGDMKFCVNAKMFQNAIKEIPDQPLSISVKDNFEIRINYSGGHFDMTGFSADEYPVMTDGEGDCIELGSREFLSNIRKAQRFCANDELRPVINGVYFNCTGAKIEYCASDSTVLCLITQEASTPKISAIIRKEDAKLMSDIFDANSTIAICISNTRSRFSCGDYTVISTNIEGKFPNYHSVIPQSQPYQFQVNRNDLINAIKRVAIFSSESQRLVVCHFGKTLKVESRDIDFSTSAEEVVNIDVCNGEMNIGFKSTLVLEILSAMESESVVLNLDSPSRAGVFRKVGDDKELFLIMPMQIV